MIRIVTSLFKRTGRIAFLFLVSALAVAGISGAQTSGPEKAMELQQQGNFPAAEKEWRAWLAANPQDAAAFASLGVVLSRQEKYEQAAVAYRKSLALGSNLPGIQLNLGLAEFKRGAFKEAIPPLRAALAADPKNVQSRALLGLSYYGSGQ